MSMNLHTSKRPASRHSPSAGQTLVILLVFMAMAMTITISATVVTLVNTRAASAYSSGEDALSLAETGADNALLRLLRDPAYTGESMTIGNGNVTITVSGTTTRSITSRGTSGGFVRTVQVTATMSNNTLVTTSWKELP